MVEKKLIRFYFVEKGLKSVAALKAEAMTPRLENFMGSMGYQAVSYREYLQARKRIREREAKKARKR